MAEVVKAQVAPSPQAVIDGLPQYTIYMDTPGSPPLPGPRSPGGALFVGKDYDSNGYLQGSPQDPTPSPMQVGQVARTVPGVGATARFRMRTPKMLVEPAQYVPGQGWVSLADVKQG